MIFNKNSARLFFILLLCLIFNTKSFSQESSPIDVLNYELNLDLYKCFKEPFKNSFDGSVIISIKATEPSGQVNLNASNTSLKILSVSEAGLSFTHENNMLIINLDKLYSEGDEFNIKINYNHKNGNDSAFFARDGMVFTDCETSRARRWFPCNDTPSDKALLSLTAIVPSDVLLCSNGSLADSTVNGDTLTYKWVSKHTIATYLIALIGYTNYNLDVVYWKRPDGTDMPVRFYSKPGETAFNINNVKKKIGKMLTLYSDLFGEYPFEKLAYATTNTDFVWGGMENQTIITLCPDCWTEDLATHELAHQWFGDMITPESWKDIWLNEGFATYLEALWYEDQKGYKAYKNDINQEAKIYLRYKKNWAIYDKSWNVNLPNDEVLFEPAIAYSKAGCVLHLLRYILGDEVFFNCLKTYATDPEFMYGNVNTQQFIDLVNEVSGRDLNWFFDEWLYTPNHPVYNNNYKVDETENGKWKLNYTIVQVQENTGFFKMPVEIKVTFENGSDTLLKVENDYNVQMYEFEFSDEPKKVTFDPDDQILLKEVKN